MKYLVMKVTEWRGLQIEVTIWGVTCKTDVPPPTDGSTGFCSVFDDYEKALKYAGKLELVLAVQEALE